MTVLCPYITEKLDYTSVRYKIIGEGRQEAKGKRQEWEELI